MGTIDPRLARDILPPEMWWKIMRNLTDSMDKFRLATSANDMKQRVFTEEQRSGWALDQVIHIPAFQHWMGVNGLLKEVKIASRAHKEMLENDLTLLRQLKVWHQGLDNQQPTTIADWKSSQHPFKFEKRHLPGVGYEWAKFRGDVNLNTNEKLVGWIVCRRNDDALHCPFPQKSLIVNVNDDYLSRHQNRMLLRSQGRVRDRWTTFYLRTNFHRLIRSMLEIMQRFGTHLHFFKVICPILNYPTSIGHFANNLMEMLEMMPNLKELAFACGDIHFFGTTVIREAPEMASLESLSLTGYPNPLSSFLLQKYGYIVRKLIIDIRIIRRLVRRAPLFADYFAATELIILNDCSLGADYHYRLLTRELLETHFFLNVIKLVIDLNFFTPTHIINVLEYFPNLVFLEIVERPDLQNHCARTPTAQNMGLFRLRCIPAIRFLVLPFRQQINYDFLEIFQSLHEIKFVSKTDRPSGWVQQLHLGNSTRFPNIQRLITTGEIGNSNVWRRLPNLETVFVEWNGWMLTYRRPRLG